MCERRRGTAILALVSHLIDLSVWSQMQVTHCIPSIPSYGPVVDCCETPPLLPYLTDLRITALYRRYSMDR